MKFTMTISALLFSVLMLGNAAYAESPREQLKQMIEQLQKSPDDNALREKIIALAKTITPAPALPDEAERRMARGTEAFKEAKSTADYRNAVKEFQQATVAAPWYGDAYFNLGLAQDKAEDFASSLRSLKLAQLASPDSKDIKDLYYKVEYQRDKYAEQNSASAKKAARNDWLLGEWSYVSWFPGWGGYQINRFGTGSGIAQANVTGNTVEIGPIIFGADTSEKVHLVATTDDSGNISWSLRWGEAAGHCGSGKQVPVVLSVGDNKRTIQFQVDFYSGAECDANWPWAVKLMRR